MEQHTHTQRRALGDREQWTEKGAQRLKRDLEPRLKPNCHEKMRVAMATQEPPSKHVSRGGSGARAWAGGSHALTRDYVHKWWALSRQVKKGGPGTRSAPSLRTAPPVKTSDFFPSEADLPCEGDSARGPRVLKGHPPGCFHSVSGQNAGLVSHLEW